MTYYLFIWVCLRTILVICRARQSVFTLLMYGIYADLPTWIKMWNRPIRTKQPTHRSTITDCNTHPTADCSDFCLQFYICLLPVQYRLSTFFTLPLMPLHWKQMRYCILRQISPRAPPNHVNLKPFPSVSERLHLIVSTFNASLCMHSPAAMMLWMDNGQG